ncbi:hypothetical protein SISNIDRAFT_465297 [Sistotremastrum niveocremeum HHB9708]|uniref:Uncharacterized protein n=1 Tax=Sistotremastrum niveocremeum HHB9708 TaxID=1314777 RepID=A0A164VQE6_9AGAM|nr:hypothetical protein SISNIDRAFT_465297 [Sistotremastrum niveocremeum HHB9708]
MEQHNNILPLEGPQQHPQNNLNPQDRRKLTLLAEQTLLHRRFVEDRHEPIPSHWLEPFQGYEQTDDTYLTWRLRLIKYFSEAIRLHHDYTLENLPVERAEGVEGGEVQEGPVKLSAWQAIPNELIQEILRLLAEQGMAEGLSSKAHTIWHLQILTTSRWLEVALDTKKLWAAIDFTQPDSLIDAIRDFCEGTPIRHVRHNLTSLQIDSLDALQAAFGIPVENITDVSLSLKLSQVQIVRDLPQLPRSSLLRSRLSISNDAMPEPAEAALPDLGPVAHTVTHLALLDFDAPLYSSLSPALNGCNALQELDLCPLDLARMNPVTIGLVLKHHRQTLRVLRCVSHAHSMPMLAPEAEAAIEAADLPQPGEKKLDLERLDYLGLGAMTRTDVDATLTPFNLPPRHRVELLVLPEEFVNNYGEPDSQFLFPAVLHPDMARAAFLKVTTRHELMTVSYGNAEFTHTIFGVSPFGFRHRRPVAGTTLHWPSQTCEEIARLFRKVKSVEIFGLLPSAAQWQSLLQTVFHHSQLAVFGSSADDLLRALRNDPYLGNRIRDLRLWVLDYEDPHPGLPDPPDDVIKQRLRRDREFATLARRYFKVNNKMANPLSTLTTRFYNDNAERRVAGSAQPSQLSAAETRTIFPAQKLDEDGWIEDSPWLSAAGATGLQQNCRHDALEATLDRDKMVRDSPHLANDRAEPVHDSNPVAVYCNNRATATHVASESGKEQGADTGISCSGGRGKRMESRSFKFRVNDMASETV